MSHLFEEDQRAAVSFFHRIWNSSVVIKTALMNHKRCNKSERKGGKERQTNKQTYTQTKPKPCVVRSRRAWLSGRDQELQPKRFPVQVRSYSGSRAFGQGTLSLGEDWKPLVPLLLSYKHIALPVQGRSRIFKIHYVRPSFTVSRLSRRNFSWSSHYSKTSIWGLNGFPSWRGYNDWQFWACW